MLKRLLVSFSAILLLTMTILTGPASAVGSTDASGSANTSDTYNPIWAGLRDGANLQFSSDREQTPTPPVVQNPQVVPPNSGLYVALGDSVAAGMGLPLSTTHPDDERCKRSTSAYGYTVASQLNMPLQHIACSGATAGDLFTRQGISGTNIAPQLDAAFASGTPALVSLTAGANDVHWNEFMAKCFASTCGTRSDTRIVNGYLSWLQLKLHYAFYSIYTRSGQTPPLVIVTGYYNPVSATCSALDPRLTLEEVNWIGAEVAALNQTIQNVASQYSFVKFAPVDFTGHDVCSASSWVQGASDPAPFHPNVAGQQAMAKSVLESR